MVGVFHDELRDNMIRDSKKKRQVFYFYQHDINLLIISSYSKHINLCRNNLFRLKESTLRLIAIYVAYKPPPSSGYFLYCKFGQINIKSFVVEISSNLSYPKKCLSK